MTSMQFSRTGFRSLWRLWNRAQILQRPRCSRQHFRYQSTILHRDNLPRILQPSLWQTIIPSSVRTRTKELFTNRENRSHNPANYFIWIYLFIGSQAIRIVTVKNEYQVYSRKADLQIDKLREVVRKLLAGEEVDAEKVLGTGVPEEEEAWEQALREIENEERMWQLSKKEKREQKARRAAEQERQALESQDASPVNTAASSETPSQMNTMAPAALAIQQPPRAPGFY